MAKRELDGPWTMLRSSSSNESSKNAPCVNRNTKPESEDLTIADYSFYHNRVFLNGSMTQTETIKSTIQVKMIEWNLSSGIACFNTVTLINSHPLAQRCRLLLGPFHEQKRDECVFSVPNDSLFERDHCQSAATDRMSTSRRMSWG